MFNSTKKYIELKNNKLGKIFYKLDLDFYIN